MSRWLRDYLISSGVDSSKVFYAGGGNIDPSLVNYSKKKGNKFLFVGRDFKRKNGQLVIDAFKIARSHNSELELYIAVDDKFKIEQDGIIEVRDFSNNKEKYYNMCDVFVMPSKFEAFGLVFAEALTYGLPCIGIKKYEMPYIIEDNITGYLLEDENPYTLAD